MWCQHLLMSHAWGLGAVWGQHLLMSHAWGLGAVWCQHLLMSHVWGLGAVYTVQGGGSGSVRCKMSRGRVCRHAFRGAAVGRARFDQLTQHVLLLPHAHP